MPRPPSLPEKPDDMRSDQRRSESKTRIFRRCRQPDQCSGKEVMAKRTSARQRENREQREGGHEAHRYVCRQEVGVSHVKEIDSKECRREESLRQSKRENA